MGTASRMAATDVLSPVFVRAERADGFKRSKIAESGPSSILPSIAVGRPAVASPNAESVVVSPLVAPEVSEKSGGDEVREQNGLDQLFVANSVEGWKHPEGLNHNGLLVKRPRQWDTHQAWVDRAAAGRFFGENESIGAEPVRNGSREELEARLRLTVSEILSKTQAGGESLPAPLAEQIGRDVCSIGTAVGELCPSSPFLEVRLEIMGENTCARWHQDNYVGRAIVSYTGATGTDYTPDSNVNIWEMENCGNNDHIIHNQAEVRSVDVGDILFIKGKGYPEGAKAMIHKSAEKHYGRDGRLVHRLVLKVDVPLAPDKLVGTMHDALL